MKQIYLLCITAVLCMQFTTDNVKKHLLCQKWKQVGLKSFEKGYKAIDPSMAETLTLKDDGTYDETLYSTLHMTGIWKLSIDSSKLAWEVITMNGNRTQDMKLQNKNPTDSIIKLNKDTLIYGSLGYYGENREYGHDDFYFVREK